MRKKICFVLMCLTVLLVGCAKQENDAVPKEIAKPKEAPTEALAEAPEGEAPEATEDTVIVDGETDLLERHDEEYEEDEPVRYEYVASKVYQDMSIGDYFVEKVLTVTENTGSYTVPDNPDTYLSEQVFWSEGEKGFPDIDCTGEYDVIRYGTAEENTYIYIHAPLPCQEIYSHIVRDESSVVVKDGSFIAVRNDKGGYIIELMHSDDVIFEAPFSPVGTEKIRAEVYEGSDICDCGCDSTEEEPCVCDEGEDCYEDADT